MGRVKDAFWEEICAQGEDDQPEQDYPPPECTCRMPFIHSAMIDPPEPILDPWCPQHGQRDPDYELQRQRDDREIDF